MKRSTRRLAWVAATLVVFVLAVGIALKVTLTPEKLRAEIERRTAEATGLPVEVGSANLSFVPFGVHLRGLRLGTEAAPFVELQSGLVRLDLAPLLSRQVVVSRITLDSPRVTLVRGPDGIVLPGRLGDRADAVPAEPAAGPSAAEAGAAAFTTTVEWIEIRDGHLGIVSLDGAEEVSLDGIGLGARLEIVGGGETVRTAGSCATTPIRSSGCERSPRARADLPPLAQIEPRPRRAALRAARTGLPPNHTAGGINMNFFPMGAVVRRTGIFFIRRSFKDNETYKFVLQHYIDFLIEKRFPLEWYIEGGRSRSGKLLPPRYGMLAYAVDAYRRGKSEDVFVIGYLLLSLFDERSGVVPVIVVVSSILENLAFCSLGVGFLLARLTRSLNGQKTCQKNKKRNSPKTSRHKEREADQKRKTGKNDERQVGMKRGPGNSGHRQKGSINDSSQHGPHRDRSSPAGRFVVIEVDKASTPLPIQEYLIAKFSKCRHRPGTNVSRRRRRNKAVTVIEEAENRLSLNILNTINLGRQDSGLVSSKDGQLIDDTVF